VGCGAQRYPSRQPVENGGLLRRPTGGVEVNCLTLLAGEATLDSVALYDGPKVLGEFNCWIFEAGIVDRNYSTSIVDKALQCLSHDETLRVRLVSVGERTVCGKENLHDIAKSPENSSSHRGRTSAHARQHRSRAGRRSNEVIHT
jgi:hypothetical protein